MPLSQIQEQHQTQEKPFFDAIKTVYSKRGTKALYFLEEEKSKNTTTLRLIKKQEFQTEPAFGLRGKHFL